MRTSTITLTCVAVILAAAGRAQAALVVTIERTSDTTANISSTGTLDTAGVTHISLNGALGGNGGSDNDIILAPGFLNFGGYLPDFYFGHFSSPNFVMNKFIGAFLIGASSGTATVQLSQDIGTEAWASIGSSGTVHKGNSGSGVQLGTWSIGAAAPVPEPASLAAFGLLGLALVYHRRRKNK